MLLHTFKLTQQIKAGHFKAYLLIVHSQLTAVTCPNRQTESEKAENTVNKTVCVCPARHRTKPRIERMDGRFVSTQIVCFYLCLVWCCQLQTAEL